MSLESSDYTSGFGTIGEIFRMSQLAWLISSVSLIIETLHPQCLYGVEF